MTVDLTENMILAIEVAFAELQTGEWQQFVDEDKQDDVEEGQYALESIIREHKEGKKKS